MAEPKGNVLPIYFVADESGSMADDVDKLNEGLASLLDELHKESMTAAKVRFSIVGFNDDARCHLALADLRHIDSMPVLSAACTTSYAAAFRDLRSRIPQDVAQLKSEGYRVHRPAMFFLSDGLPNNDDPWLVALADLKSDTFKERPNILAFGIRDARPEIIAQVASQPQYAFQQSAGSDTGRAVREFAVALTRSIVTSGQALAGGRAELQVQPPEGFTLAIPEV